MIPAIVYEPDGYELTGKRLMGRQSAGHGFLRAAIGAADPAETLFAVTPNRPSADAFARFVAAARPGTKAGWIAPHRLDVLARHGALYIPDSTLAEASYRRLRGGTDSYSITGVTHTTASDNVMRQIAELLVAPVMPWDAIVCTSKSVLATIETILAAQADYLSWRLGAKRPAPPLLPVIPLGVHTADFAFSDEARGSARRTLGLADDEVAFLFLGRLSFHAKAHPFPMYRALEDAAQATGRKVVLIQCGWFANAAIENTFKGGAARFAPSVRSLWLDGRERAERDKAWAASDVFMSLSDNIQETFGLTPIEAMSAGLPVIATDWDGYRETLRHGTDGFLVPTFMPGAPLGNGYALAYQAGAINYDAYSGLTCQHISVDMAALDEAIRSLLAQPDLRRRLGESGRARAREVFDWSAVIGQYLELWREQDRRRRAGHAQGERGVAMVPARALDPFHLFASYPTTAITPDVLVQARVSPHDWAALSRDAFFAYAARHRPSVEDMAKLIAAIPADRPITIAETATKAGWEVGRVILAIATLAKAGLASLQPPNARKP